MERKSEDSQLYREAIRFARACAEVSKGSVAGIDIMSRFLAAGICFPDHLFHIPTVVVGLSTCRAGT